MARPTKEQRLAKLHSDARAEFDRIWSSSKDVRLQCTTVRRFTYIPGGQWEGRLGEQFEHKPKPEVNKMQLAVQRINSEYRQNRITANFIPKDGTDSNALADTCDGLYRADEQDSCAQEAYDNAFDEGVTGGMGAWRLRCEYENEEDDEDERQRIRMEPIYDADSSVFFNIDAKRYDKSDAKCCYVIYSMTPQAYKEVWGDDPASWPKDAETTEFDWCTPDVVYLAEYYEVVFKRETVHVFVDTTDNEVEYTDDELMDFTEVEGDGETVENAIAQMTVRGFAKVREKSPKRRRVRKYIMSGSKILEDCGYIAGKYIPIIPFYAKRLVIDGVERILGHGTLAQDVQRIINTQYSKLMELNALSSTQKPILTPEQVAGHQVMWQQDNLLDYPYLLVNPITDISGNPQPAGPVAYTQPPTIPPALGALMQFSQQDQMDILGRPQDGQEVMSNISGKAVEMIQQRLDVQAYLYMSNFAKSMQWCAAVWLSAAKEIYTEAGRKMKSIGGRGNLESVTLSEVTLDPKTGELIAKNDLSKADFDVTVDVGPSFQSKRQATVRSLIGLLQVTTDPADAKILQAAILMNMEGEGLSEINEYYRKALVEMGVEQPNEEEAAQMAAMAEQEQQPDPQTVFLQTEGEKNLSIAELNNAKALQIASDVDKNSAEIENIDADTALKEAETLEKLRTIGESPL